MNPLVVVAPPTVAPGFALGGATVRAVPDGEVGDGAAVERAVESALAEGAEVVAVHPEVWSRLPRSARTAYGTRTDRLVVCLPADTGPAAPEREAELHELLARAVGYEISFTGGGE